MPKQPEDHKPKVSNFTWESPNGGTITLVPMKRVPVGVQRKSRGKSDEERMWLMIEACIVDDADLDVLDELAAEDLETLMQEWAAHSEVELPQS